MSDIIDFYSLKGTDPDGCITLDGVGLMGDDHLVTRWPGGQGGGTTFSNAACHLNIIEVP